MTATRPKSGAATHSGDYQLRIIGGQWRGSRLNFPRIAAIRPTPDRVRETLFNWLQTNIVGAHCLDLFAGSGALGLEALSRGAQSTTFIDLEVQIIRYLKDTLARLKCESATVTQGNAVDVLKHSSHTYDVVFLDPPFDVAANSPLLTQLFALLDAPGRLSDHAWVYLECPSHLQPTSLPGWPAHWQLHRSKQAGQVGYHLVRTQRPTP